MTDDTMKSTRTVDAPPEAVFDVLADPTTHQAIDGTGGVRESLDGKPLTEAGQVFRMAMYHPAFEGGHYEMANRVEVFQPPYAIAWLPGRGDDDADLDFGGWFWRYDLEPTGDGRTAVTLICLDPEAGAYLEILLAKLARPGMCNATDPLPTVDADPDPGAAAADLRTTSQRNHDAVKAALRALLASGQLGQHRGLPVTAIITMTLQQLETASGIARTGGGSFVPMETALRMAAHAHHYLYIYDQTCGRPLFLGRSQRLASADQRIVLHAIDAGCTMPGCDQPAYHCDVHHLIEWTPDGTTDIDRLTLLCQTDHQQAGPTDEQWQARRRYDEQTLGQTLWHPPKTVDPSRQPKTNRHHRRPKRPEPGPEAA